MLDINDFSAKQIVVFMPSRGDKLSYKNDNLIIKNADGDIKYQHTCYRIFLLLVVGDCTITTGLMKRAKKFGFSICFMSHSFRIEFIVKNGLQGNNYLHRKQYSYENTEIGRVIILNKIRNQRRTLEFIRNKSEFVKEGIVALDKYIEILDTSRDLSKETILGYEGNAAKVYFPRVFENTQWQARKPRIKFDYINCLLDIGYTILFNFIDCVLQTYDFDVYEGVLHTAFYMRKSLVCDLMEPFRTIIDWRVRKGINLKQFKQEDFVLIDNQYQLEYKKNGEYIMPFMEDILRNKEQIFLYLRAYYRAFMKGKDAEGFPEFDISSREIILP